MVKPRNSEPKNNWLLGLEAYLERLVLDVQQTNYQHSAFAKTRIEKRNTTNLKYVLRNYISQLVINKGDQGEHKLLREVYAMLQNPVNERLK
jgi:uncharacterized protein YdiU (UPF0061 family)